MYWDAPPSAGSVEFVLAPELGLDATQSSERSFP